MPTEAMLSSGVKITVDSSDIDVKFTKSIEQLNKERTKSQRLLRLEYDAQGRLNDALGRCVEGLSLYQQKLGMWIDEAGRARTIAGGFADDLSRTELELGYYSDELGNVKNRSGEFVRLTKEAADAQTENAAALQRTREAFSASFQGLADSVGRFSSIVVLLDSADGSISSLGQKFASFSQGLSASFSVFKATTDLTKGLVELSTNSRKVFSSLASGFGGATANAKGLKGAVAALAPAFSSLGGPIGLAVSGIAAIGAGILAYKASTSINDKLSDSFKEIEKSAKKAGDSIKSLGDALHYGAFQTPLSEYDAAVKRIEDAAAKLKKAQDEYNSTMRSVSSAGGMSGVGAGAGFMGEKELATAKAERKNAWAEYADVVKQMIATAREEQKTELQKLEAQRKAFQDIQDLANTNEELKNDSEARAVVEKQIQVLDAKIKEAKDREAVEAANALKKAQADARRSLGIDQYLLQPAKKAGLTLEAFDETVKEWREKAKELEIDEKELDDAIKRYKTAVDENVKNELARRLGVDFGSSGALSLNEKFIELRKAYSDGIVGAQANANALAQLQDERARELAEVSDSIKESQKVADAEEKRAAALNRVAEEYYAERISAEQFLSLRQKVESDFLETTKKFADERRQALERELGVSFDQGAAAKASEAFAKYSERLAKLQTARDNLEITQKQFNAGLSQLKDSAIAALPNLSNLMSSANQAATAEKEHAATLKEINEALKKRLIGEQDAARLRELANKREEERLENERKQKVSSLGLDAFIAAGEKEKSAREKIDEQFGKIRKAFHEGLISQDQMNKATKSRTNQLKELRRQEKEAARQAAAQRRQDMRSKLGIDSLMESLKTPLQKYRETMDEIASATKMGAISKAERFALENKAVDDYWNAMRETKEDKATSQRAKTELAKSMSSGSAELYLSQVKNQTANYQSRIQQTTENLYKTSQEALYQSQQTNYYLQEMLANNGGVGVWGS